MHIEKNVCDNIIGTLLNIEGKTKDHYKARMDLKLLNVRPGLHPTEESAGRISLPNAPYTMSNKQKEDFCDVLKKVKVPDGYSSNISRCVDSRQRKIMGLKSHDCHILMQELLGVALRAANLPDHVTSSLIQVCNFFKIICSKVLNVDELEKLELNIAYTLCELERIFPPSFFTIMIHLIVHLAVEARMCGPVHYRWMYSIERNLHTLKGYVGNKACPEGSIAERYIAYECLNLCSRYFNDVETRFTRPLRNNDNGENVNHMISSTSFAIAGRPIGKATPIELDSLAYEQAHRYVLFNTDDVNCYKLIHQQSIRRQNRSTRPSECEILKIHLREFSKWFTKYVNHLEEVGSQELTDIVKCLASGPDHNARSYTGYIVNGIRFHTRGREENKKTQNSGVVVEVEGDVPYYGVLVDIIELTYARNTKVVLFRCEWVDVRGEKASKLDRFGYRCVDLSRLFHTGRNFTDDPFVFASQAQQVFYVEDKAIKGWHVAIKTRPRDMFDEGVDLDAEEVNDQIEDNMEAVLVLPGVNLGDQEQLPGVQRMEL